MTILEYASNIRKTALRYSQFHMRFKKNQKLVIHTKIIDNEWHSKNKTTDTKCNCTYYSN